MNKEKEIVEIDEPEKPSDDFDEEEIVVVKEDTEEDEIFDDED